MNCKEPILQSETVSVSAMNWQWSVKKQNLLFDDGIFNRNRIKRLRYGGQKTGSSNMFSFVCA